MTPCRAAGAIALATLLLTGAAQAQSCPGGFSDGFRLKGHVKTPATFKLADLKKLPSSRVTVTYFSGSAGLVTKTYVGVPLIDLLNAAEVKTNPSQRNDILRKYVSVRATDCYESVIAVADLLPNFGAQQVLIAYQTEDGDALDKSEGMARLIVAGDKQGGRLVSNVKAVLVRSSDSDD
ncbi:molybdopterin-dependent oxidoreductase [Methylopila sp. M107]|uniref:molybdopterin-dependent oxidoreductase n=1 Tax=Methylopila sp. M107 TaxID=1101190 RepID=UPI000374689C|nr:molybdopterin-dependent oxidoreductase [Methylopila sp. M107]